MKTSRTLRLAAALSAATLIATPVAQAQSFVWDGDTDAFWGTAANWTGNAAPTGANGNLTFSGSGNLNNTNNSSATGFMNITFAADAGAFVLGGTGLTWNFVAGQTITNNSANLQTINFNITTAGNRTFAGAGDFQVGGNILSGGPASGIIMGGAGNLTLSGSNTFIHLNLNSGNVIINSAGALNSTAGSEASVTTGASSTGTLTLNGNSIVIRSLASNATPGSPIIQNRSSNAAVLTVGNSLNLSSTFNGTIQDGVGGGALRLTKNGTGTLTLGGANSYTGNTTVNSGVLNFATTTSLYGGNEASWTKSNLLVNSGGGLAFSTGGAGQFSSANVTTLLSNLLGDVTTGGFKGGSTIGLDVTTGTFTWNSTLSDTTGTGGGAISLLKSGAGTLSLGGSNNYSGNTLVSLGALTLTSNSALGSTAGNTTVAANASLRLSNGLNITGEDLAISGTGGTPSGGNGQGALNLIGAASGEGTAATWAGNIFLAATGRVGVNQIGNLTISGAISGGANSTLEIGAEATLGSSRVIISAAEGVNNYLGQTHVVRGTLALGAHNTLPFGTILNVGTGGTVGARFDLNGFNQTVAGLAKSSAGTLQGRILNNGASAATFTINSTTDQTFSGNITDGTSLLNLVKAGAGNQTLSNVNTYSGSTTIFGGSLILSGNGTIGTGNLVMNGGTLNISAITASSYTLATSQSLTGNGTIVTTGKTFVVDGDLSPGNSPGLLQITGNMTIGANATTTMELAGSGGVKGTDFDNIAVSETLTYDGVLNIVSFDGFSLNTIGSYDLYDAATALSGNFASISVGATSLTHSSGVWTGNNGVSTYTFTNSTGALDIAAIPEPSTALLLGAGLAGLAVLRRRRKSA